MAILKMKITKDIKVFKTNYVLAYTYYDLFCNLIESYHNDMNICYYILDNGTIIEYIQLDWHTRHRCGRNNSSEPVVIQLSGRSGLHSIVC